MSLSATAPDTGFPAAPVSDTAARRSASRRAVGVWLLGVCALIFIMVLVGGATRLTDSGLSITEWRPVTGALPPLSAEAWDSAFAKYKQIPEYQEINRGMSLAEFKTIYWWEWGHRQLGRLIGLAFALPFFFFLMTRRLERPLAWKCFGLLILGGSQGALGWFMVQSGLTERVDVSQYRLAAHLSLALVIFSAVLWVALDVLRRAPSAGPMPAKAALPVWPAALFLAVLGAQIFMGGIVAGLDAGLIYNSWPSMNGRFLPDYAFAAGLRSLFEDHGTAQFVHRSLAYGVVAGAAGLAIWAHLIKAPGPVQTSARILAGLVLIQMALGIWTLLAQVPIGLGVAHQGGAVLLLAAGVVMAHRLTQAGCTE